jgi:hypothetical protein
VSTDSGLERLTTIECSRSGDAYTLFKSGTDLDVHLAGPGKRGGTGPILCGFDRFARDVGFSVGGGVTGPGYRHHPCVKCAELAGGRSVSGTHKSLFPSRATEVI